MTEKKLLIEESLVLIRFIKTQKRLVARMVEASRNGDIKEIYSLINELSDNNDSFQDNLDGIEELFEHEFTKEK